MEYILSAVIIILALILGYILVYRRVPAVIDTGALTATINIAVDSIRGASSDIDTMGAALPKAVLRSIQSSINPRKGKVGELVTLLRLNAEYDRIIPLGQPVDMIGISEEWIDFIEVKTNSGRLSDMERHIQELVNNKKDRFIGVKTTNDIKGKEKWT